MIKTFRINLKSSVIMLFDSITLSPGGGGGLKKSGQKDSVYFSDYKIWPKFTFLGKNNGTIFLGPIF